MESNKITNNQNPFSTGDQKELEKLLKFLVMSEEEIKQEKIKKIKEKLKDF